MDGSQPYVPNEKQIYVKLELDQDAFSRFKQERGLDASLSMSDVYAEL